MAGLTLTVAACTFVITLIILWLEGKSAYQRWRAAFVWRTLDECMRVGYALRDDDASVEEVRQWLDRVGRFCEVALGHHAKRLVLADVEAMEAEHAVDAIQRALNRVHIHIAGKVVEGRIHPDFRVTPWKGWTPGSQTPE